MINPWRGDDVGLGRGPHNTIIQNFYFVIIFALAISSSMFSRVIKYIYIYIFNISIISSPIYLIAGTTSSGRFEMNR